MRLPTRRSSAHRPQYFSLCMGRHSLERLGLGRSPRSKHWQKNATQEHYANQHNHLQKKPALIIAFSHFLLLDTFVSAIFRLLILQFFVESFYDHNICSSSYDPTWSPQNFRHDIVTSVRYQKEYLWQFSHQKSCHFALGAVKVVLVTLLICLTAAQGSLAVTTRRHGKELEWRRGDRPARNQDLSEKPRQSPLPDLEKVRYELP